MNKRTVIAMMWLPLTQPAHRMPHELRNEPVEELITG